MSASRRGFLQKITRHHRVAHFQEQRYGRLQTRFNKDLSFTQAAATFTDRNSLHAYFHHYFRHLCPAEIREHRSYFKLNGRGFGEDAFHGMWFTLLREFKPQSCLEIGVFRGQSISLWILVAKMLDNVCDVHGISPFSSAGDDVSVYPADIDYMCDTLESFAALSLPKPTLIRALSTDEVALNYIASRSWDLIYIDGSHDYEIVLADYEACVPQLKQNALLVMDDASLGTSYRAPAFSFAGHPGPSRVAKERAMQELHFLGAVGHNNVFQKR
jgi:hypothetical protein